MSASAKTIVWITGLPQSGKSTLARRARAALERPSCILDSDEVRDALVPERGYSEDDRDNFYASLGNLAAVLAGQDLVVLVAATANRRSYRERARALVERFIVVHVTADAETCATRDIKGLYSRGDIALPGRGAPYEAPAQADIAASGGEDDVALERLLALLR